MNTNDTLLAAGDALAQLARSDERPEIKRAALRALETIVVAMEHVAETNNAPDAAQQGD